MIELKTSGIALMISKFRFWATHYNCSPSDKISDEKILEIYEKVLTIFFIQSQTKKEQIQPEIFNALIFAILQIYEFGNVKMMNTFLESEIKEYQKEGMNKDFIKYKIDITHGSLDFENEANVNSLAKKIEHDIHVSILIRLKYDLEVELRNQMNDTLKNGILQNANDGVLSIALMQVIFLYTERLRNSYNEVLTGCKELAPRIDMSKEVYAKMIEQISKKVGNEFLEF